MFSRVVAGKFILTMASDLSSGCTETIDILDEKEEGEISLEDVSSSEEGGIGHLTCGYVVRTRRTCSVCKLSWGECASWCTASSKMHYSKSQSRRDPVKGKENRHHVNETSCATMKHALSTLQEKNDDLVPISSDSDMEIVGLTDASKQLTTRSKTRVKKKKKRKKEYEYLTIDDLISPASADLPITECFSTLKGSSRLQPDTSKETSGRMHYRGSSPVHRSSKTRLITRSPLRRHRSPAHPSFHGPSRSPLDHSRAPRKSPRRLRSSPKRPEPSHSPVRTSSRKQPTSSSAGYTGDRHGDVTRLLKKVKHLDSVGAHTPESSVRRNKEHQPASLKEKLSNMMKKVPDNSGSVVHGLKEKPSTQGTTGKELDEEDDLALLRQKALETKQKNKLVIRLEHPMESEEKATSAAAAAKMNDDQDEEDLQLRMIALRSAVMKKHQNRVQRGVRAKSKKKAVSKRSESPFTRSFLENIPVPHDELLKLASPPCTPPAPPSSDSNHIEDMELDTDVEREKEKLPYSPTDNTVDMPIDTELLGIEPSDVSFINLNNSPIFLKSGKRRPPPPPLGDDAMPTTDDVFPSYTPSPNHFASSPLPSDESFHLDSNDAQKSPGYGLLHPDCIECDLLDGTCCQQNLDDVGSKCGYLTVYSEPSDVPSHRALLDLPVPSLLPNLLHVSRQSQNLTERLASGDLLAASTYTEQPILANVQQDSACAYDMAFGYPSVNVPTVSALGTTLLNNNGVSVTAAYDSPENRSPQAALPTVDVDRNPSPSVDYVLGDSTVYCQADASREPLYMQGVPDITKDANKIPTLINKTLVPVPILKSNKQLQQPLPAKSELPHTEPSFKSAEMQPVAAVTDANGTRSGAIFKPIKLAPFPKKRHRVLTAPVVFGESVNESPENDTNGESHKASEKTDLTLAAKNDSASSSKRRKRTKRAVHLNIDLAELLTEEWSGLCTNSDVNKNVNTGTTVPPSSARRPTAEPESKKRKKRKSVDDDKARESEESTNLQVDSAEAPAEPTDFTDKDGRAENTDVVEKSDQHAASSDDPEEQKKQQTSSTKSSVECPGLSASLLDIGAATNEATEATKDRRESVDEDENELRAILLASLTKRATKSSDAVCSSVTPTTSVTTNCNATSSKQAAALKVSGNSASVSATANAGNNGLLVGVKKRPNVVPMGTKGLSKKLVKKAPASTKVVNNAKKFQNTIVQRKLNPQKLGEANILGKTKQPMPAAHQDNVWSANGPTVKKSSMAYASETQRIVINLGSDTDSEPESEKGNKAPPVATSAVNAQELNTDFEKSLHKFLREVRKEHETGTSSSSKLAALSPQATKRSTPTPVTQPDPEKDPSNMHTPLAVRHLSASKQEEYRRLKQQILEREKMKQQSKVVTKSNSVSKVSKSMSNTPVRQNQIESKESEKGSQQSSAAVAKTTDVAKSTAALNYAARVPVTKNIISTNIAKQTNSLQAKTTKKTVPNLSIRITNELSPTHVSVEGKTGENSVEFANKHQPMSDKQQFRPALRTLSKDEINRKYVKVQLKQDTTKRVVIINDKAASSSSWHDTANAGRSEESIEDSNVVAEKPDEGTAGKSDDNDKANESDISDATTVLNSNASRQELMDCMETTISYFHECERELNRNASVSSLFSASNNRDDDGTKDLSPNLNVNASGDADNTGDVWDVLKRDMKTELESLAGLPKMEQQRYLSDIENRLVARRYAVLDHFADMSGNLRQWDMEKDLQNSLAIEVKKLKEQLRLAEEMLEKQRKRVSSMGPRISTARQEINTGRRECFKLSRVCTALGNRLLGKNYKLPEAGDQLLSEKLKEVANHTRQLSKKKLSSNDASENSILPTSSFSKPSKVTLEETVGDLSLQILPKNNMATANSVVDNSQNDTSPGLEQCNDIESSSTIDTLPNEVTPARKNQTSAIVSESCNDEEDSPDQDQLLCEPKLSSTPVSVERNNECTQRNRKVDIPVAAISPVLGLSTVDCSLCLDNEQRDKKKTQSPAQPPMTTATTTTTMTTMTITTATMIPKTTSSTMMNTTPTTTMTVTTTTTTIKPYVSILTHLKTPRNANPNGILCPYDLMGICNDGDCQFVHQSTSST
ncbi:PREDICTED: platelet binding protein GspB-like [Dinoponera quadriceps]|uniref:Platelet binding protein GspB-like n=1 Tax=Dinoponera quadriceps TaxID=609295 RepID=A0A6P3WTV1_DINQU|nr:PREDICTED: platelet binding protein GspB-like [Dinoponera quadriceps]XP_014469558.1 PREDICTED: platelet binding protein GspB-like [Dinoponera quadriceps]